MFINARRNIMSEKMIAPTQEESTPASKAVVISVKGGVIIRTKEDKRVIFITPTLARQLSAELSKMADQADGITEVLPIVLNHSQYIQ
jgi:hypothetical protein